MECTQDLEKHDGFLSIYQICFINNSLNDLSVDCNHCGKRTHVFWAETNFVNLLIISGSPYDSRI